MPGARHRLQLRTDSHGRPPESTGERLGQVGHFRVFVIRYEKRCIGFLILDDANFTCGVTAHDTAAGPSYQSPRYSMKIMGGRESDRFRWPWQVAVLSGSKVGTYPRKSENSSVSVVFFFLCFLFVCHPPNSMTVAVEIVNFRSSSAAVLWSPPVGCSRPLTVPGENSTADWWSTTCSRTKVTSSTSGYAEASG